jgi:hypothetical protein
MKAKLRRLFRNPLLMSAVVSLSGLVATASATTTFTATLDGLQNVPPVPSVTATGTATMTLNDAQTELSFVIHVNGLSSPEISSHFHNAGRRDNGPIVFNLPLGNTKVGTWAIPPDMVTELFAGRIFVNIHTENYLSGEIRGNVSEDLVPVEQSTWGKIKLLYE